jgi:Tfp pilus assembly protein PilP
VVAQPARAQAPQPTAPTPAPGSSNITAPNPDLPAPPANYEYAPVGRRDPFLSLVKSGNDPRGDAANARPTKRAEGVPGLLTEEIAVRGILRSRGQWIAMVAGSDNKVYSLRAGDRLADGHVRAITSEAVVILQEVSDPLSLEKQREVRKFLRGGEEVK